jgi:pyrimidine operon attenuation protein/uracil phosphoribosyltransferase
MNIDIDVDQLLEQVGQQLKAHLELRHIQQPMLVGIRTGGIWLAERLHRQLALETPMGELDISFYRDDFTQVGLNPKVQPSALPLTTEDRHIVLIDDVIMSGRTIRAALNELFDYGRPASVTLVALVELDARELPIRADIIGRSLALKAGEQIKLTGPSPLELVIQHRASKPNPS